MYEVSSKYEQFFGPQGVVLLSSICTRKNEHRQYHVQILEHLRQPRIVGGGLEFFSSSRQAIYFFQVSVLLETGEINTFIYANRGGFYRRQDVDDRRQDVYDRRQGEKSDDHSPRGPKASTVHSCAGATEAHERTARHSPLPIDWLAAEDLCRRSGRVRKPHKYINIA